MALAWTREHAPALHTRVAAALGLVLNDSGRARDAHAELGLAIERSGVTDATDRVGRRRARLYRDRARVTVRGAADGGRPRGAARGRRHRRSTSWRSASPASTGRSPRSPSAPSSTRPRHSRSRAAGRTSTTSPWRSSTTRHVLVELGRLDEAEALLDEAAPLLPQLGASNVDADGIFDELAAARGDWARAARLFLANAQAAERNPGLKGIILRLIAIALAHLGADEDAVELAATANAICESIGEAPSDPLTTRYGQALDEARERLGAERAARAARRGAALSEAESLTRAAEMVQAACVT